MEVESDQCVPKALPESHEEVYDPAHPFICSKPITNEGETVPKDASN